MYQVQCDCYTCDYWESTTLFHTIIQQNTSFVAEVDIDCNKDHDNDNDFNTKTVVIGYILCHSVLDINKPPKLGHVVSSSSSKVWYIHDLVVQVPYRKQGIADQLIYTVEH